MVDGPWLPGTGFIKGLTFKAKLWSSNLVSHQNLQLHLFIVWVLQLTKKENPGPIVSLFKFIVFLKLSYNSHTIISSL